MRVSFFSLFFRLAKKSHKEQNLKISSDEIIHTARQLKHLLVAPIKQSAINLCLGAFLLVATFFLGKHVW
jgi:hypothetical protein